MWKSPAASWAGPSSAHAPLKPHTHLPPPQLPWVASHAFGSAACFTTFCVHAPSWEAPLAAEHAAQAPPHAVSQQTPSTHRAVSQSEPSLHSVPRALGPAPPAPPAAELLVTLLDALPPVPVAPPLDVVVESLVLAPLPPSPSFSGIFNRSGAASTWQPATTTSARERFRTNRGKGSRCCMAVATTVNTDAT